MSPEPDDPRHAGSAPDPALGFPSVGPNDLAWSVPRWVMFPLGGGLCGLSLWILGWDWALVSLLPFSVFVAAICVIDLRELRVPNKMVGPASIVAVPLFAISAASDVATVSFWRCVAGAAIMGGIYLLFAVIYPPGMGFGDVKFAPLVGAQLGLFGWLTFMRGLVLAFLSIGPVAVLLLLFGRANRHSGLPFAPFMVIGAFLALVMSRPTFS